MSRRGGRTWLSCLSRRWPGPGDPHSRWPHGHVSPTAGGPACLPPGQSGGCTSGAALRSLRCASSRRPWQGPCPHKSPLLPAPAELALLQLLHLTLTYFLLSPPNPIWRQPVVHLKGNFIFKGLDLWVDKSLGNGCETFKEEPNLTSMLITVFKNNRPGR